MSLSDGEKKLLKIFCEDYSDKLGNAGCNDLTDEMLACLSKDEWNELNKLYHEKNGDPEEYYENGSMMDFSVFWILTKKLGL